MKKLLLLIFISFLFSSGKAQISPGDLTKAHAHLEGLSNCTSCHVLGEQVQNSKCLDCHKEINELINLNRGFHSGSDVKGKNCWQCHSEHHGRNFKIVNFNPKQFDHTKTKFELTGAHKKAECNSCHQKKFIKDPDLKKRENTWLGLSMDCASCHEDFHQGTLEKDCASCHNTEAFRPAPKFDHNKTKFKLTGAHIKIECIQCHPKEKKEGKDFQKFKGISFAACVSCHKDPHQGKFGNDCQSCHNTNIFQEINRGSFDHSKTNFPLLGKHQAVSCNKCHGNNLTSKPKHEKCIDCHEDYHKGEFTESGKIKDCAACHTEKGFSPSTFSFKDHQQTDFPLTGNHLAIPCQSCHYKDEAWHFKNIGKKCIDCHQNIHGKEITHEVMPDNNCTACHSADGWLTIAFDHGKTDFPLLGKHKDVSCGACHVNREADEKIYKFSSLNSDCGTCHNDIHFGQFENNCSECHTFDNWKPEKFDHEKTRFSLKGAHAKLECSACHKKVTVNGNQFVKFKLEDFKCAACHSS